MNDFLDEEYEKLKNNKLSPIGRRSILNNIVQIKLKEKQCSNFNNDISIDIKKLINSIIDVAENASQRYDGIDKNAIVKLTSNFSYKVQISYLDYTIRQLQKSSFTNEIKLFQQIRIEIILKYEIKKIYKPKSFAKLAFYAPLYNVWTLLATIISIGILGALISLPAPCDFMRWYTFELTYLKVVDNFTLNHFINVISSMVGINDEFKIKTNDGFTLAVFIFVKCFVFIYVSSMLFSKLTDYLKR